MNIDEWLKCGKPWNVILHGDCMDLMKHFNDKEVSLSIEKDVDYYKASVERLEILRSQGTLF